MNHFASLFAIEMLLLYGISLIGFIARKIKVFNEHAVTVLTQLILYITLPALILYSLDITFSLTILHEFLWLIGLSFVSMTGAIILASWLGKLITLPHHQKHVFKGIIIFGNQGFIGYAIMYILFQEQGVLYLTIFNIYYLILIWTYGIYLFTKQAATIDWKNIFLNPGIISTVLGLICFLTPLSIPKQIGLTLHSIGTMTVPLSMMVIGCLIADIDFKQITQYLRNYYLWLASLLKLLLIPLLLLPFVYFELAFPLLATAVIVSGMPTASTMSLYAQKFGGDSYFASIGVLITTCLCIVTVPLLYLIVYGMYQ